MRRMKRSVSSSTLLYVVAGALALVFVAVALLNARRAAVPSPYDGFAQCLAEKDATMYGAWWCPHCQNQKKLFGSAFQYVPYVECSPGRTKTMSAQCRDAGVEGYPMWKFSDGSTLSGEQTLEELAEKTACELPASSN